MEAPVQSERPQERRADGVAPQPAPDFSTEAAQQERRADGVEPQPAPRSSTEAAETMERTLERFESMPRELAELKQALTEVFQRLEDALDDLGIGAQRLSDKASQLAQVAGRLEGRVNDLSRSLGQSHLPREREPASPSGPVAPEEPQFRPSDHAVGIVLAAVPGFQGLMDMQRALSGLPAAEGASVVGYKNGEASLEMVLRAPVTAREIVERLRESTGHQLLIEESRPEALRLRLRFIDREGRG